MTRDEKMRDPFGFSVPPTQYPEPEPEPEPPWRVSGIKLAFFLELLKFIFREKVAQNAAWSWGRNVIGRASYDADRVARAFEALGLDYDETKRLAQFLEMNVHDSLKIVRDSRPVVMESRFDAEDFIEQRVPSELLREDARAIIKQHLRELLRAIDDERLTEDMVRGTDAPSESSPW